MASDLALRLLAAWYRTKYKVVRPPYFALTGIPRSGTSLLSAMLCEPEDCFCFNEIFYDTVSLPYLLGRMRRNLLSGEPVPAKMEADGSLTTDTMGDHVVIGRRSFPRKHRGLVVGSNVNIPYLDRIDDILAYRFRILGIVRDPVYALASWNSPKARSIPEAQVTGAEMNPRWSGVAFDSSVREHRQADIWEHYTALLVSLGNRAKLVRYEDLCDRQEETMRGIYDYLGVTDPGQSRTLHSLNDDGRFGDLGEIREAVAARCPTRLELGYE